MNDDYCSLESNGQLLNFWEHAASFFRLENVYTLTINTTGSSVVSLNSYQTVRRHISEDSNLHVSRHWNPKRQVLRNVVDECECLE